MRSRLPCSALWRMCRRWLGCRSGLSSQRMSSWNKGSPLVPVRLCLAQPLPSLLRCELSVRYRRARAKPTRSRGVMAARRWPLKSSSHSDQFKPGGCSHQQQARHRRGDETALYNAHGVSPPRPRLRMRLTGGVVHRSKVGLSVDAASRAPPIRRASRLFG